MTSSLESKDEKLEKTYVHNIFYYKQNISLIFKQHF